MKAFEAGVDQAFLQCLSVCPIRSVNFHPPCGQIAEQASDMSSDLSVIPELPDRWGVTSSVTARLSKRATSRKTLENVMVDQYGRDEGLTVSCRWPLPFWMLAIPKPCLLVAKCEAVGCAC